MRTPLKVWIIDDNLADSTFLLRLLEKLPLWQVDVDVYDEFHTEEFVQFQQSPPEVVFVDYVLGAKKGTDVIRRLADTGSHAAFILLTGHGDETVVTQALRAGASDYLTKRELSHSEFSLDILDKTLRHAIQRKRTMEQLEHNAFHDRLTGLGNRALFIEHLRHSIKHTKRHEDELFAVLFLDLDRFKNINDSLGHTAGDELLIWVARRLSECLRPEDIAARLGGDEFTVLISQMKHVSDSIRVANRIQEVLSPPFNLQGHEVFITASIGIALSRIDYQHPEDVLRDADVAMYRAKELGKNRYEIFDTAMRTKAMKRLQVENDLQRAIHNNEFRVHYQPIVELRSGVIIGFEALVRWQHPNRGLLLPKEFIALAEEIGLIILIDQWVLHEACRQIREWQKRFPSNPPLVVSVNMSRKQFLQPDLIKRIEQILRETDFDPRYLKLEITENITIEQTEFISTMFSQLKAMNIGLYIDDFGTGYSSLGALHHFPVDMLKIDRSFISNMHLDGDGLAITRTIVALAGNFGMTVTAEGVESIEQLAKLRELKCEYGQGYFFAKAMDNDAAAALIAAAPHW